MRYFVIRYFLSDLDKLTKKSKDNYHTVRKDICDEFNTVEIPEEVIEKGKIIRQIKDEGMHFVVKTRIKNTAMKAGKSGGFRLINVVIQHGDRTTFLKVFPKKGKYGIDDIPDKLLEELLEEYKEALKNDTLIEVDIDNELAIINNDDE